MRVLSLFFFFNDTATTEIYTLSLHDALPISLPGRGSPRSGGARAARTTRNSHACQAVPWTVLRRGRLSRTLRSLSRSEEHTSELQSPCNLVCRLLLEKKKQQTAHEHVTQFCD